MFQWHNITMVLCKNKRSETATCSTACLTANPAAKQATIICLFLTAPNTHTLLVTLSEANCNKTVFRCNYNVTDAFIQFIIVADTILQVVGKLETYPEIVISRRFHNK